MILAAPLGVFWLVRSLKQFVSMPEWAWLAATLFLAVGAVALTSYPLCTGVAVAGAVVFVEHADDLLMLKSDELLKRLTSRR